MFRGGNEALSDWLGIDTPCADCRGVKQLSQLHNTRRLTEEKKKN